MAKKITPAEKLFTVERMLSELIKNGNKHSVLDQSGERHIEVIEIEVVELKILLSGIRDYRKSFSPRHPVNRFAGRGSF